MKAFKGVLLVLAIVGWLFGAVRANGQTFERGEIRGFVFDSSHSIVPKANVTISNPSTGYKREVQTDETTGAYDFPALLPRVYKIRAEAEGFAPTSGQIRMLAPRLTTRRTARRARWAAVRAR